MLFPGYPLTCDSHILPASDSHSCCQSPATCCLHTYLHYVGSLLSALWFRTSIIAVHQACFCVSVFLKRRWETVSRLEISDTATVGIIFACGVHGHDAVSCTNLSLLYQTLSLVFCLWMWAKLLIIELPLTPGNSERLTVSESDDLAVYIPLTFL